MNQPTEPTAEQCNECTKVFETADRVGYSIWYPQMGGYVGKAVAVMDREWSDGCGGCVDVFVWHDGEFPFSGNNDNDRKPIEIHHCDVEQFVGFGRKLSELNARGFAGSKPVAESAPAPSVDQIVTLLRSLPDELRCEVMGHFCHHCGCDNPGCQCSNDE